MKYVLHNRDSSPYSSPRITYEKFLTLLQTKNSPAIYESQAIYQALVEAMIDPSFALAHFRVESQYGTAGHAIVSHNWGNILWDRHLVTHTTETYAPGNGYTYAKYANWLDGVKDYIAYIADYTNRRNLQTINEIGAEWIGKEPGSETHLWYVGIIEDDMRRYDWPTVSFRETGDKMIYAGKCFDAKTGKIITRYPLETGTVLYKGTNGTRLTTYNGKPTTVWFFGLVNNSTAWGQIRVSTGAADPLGTLCLIKDIDLNLVIDAT